ncbi:MAG: trigger factor [Terriglobales bacterium]
MTTEACTREVEIEIPLGEVERESARISKEYQRHARIPGFRPGKAPLSMVQKKYADSIREEVLQAVVPAHLRATVQRENLEPVAEPAIRNLDFTAGQPIRFKAVFEVLPQFDLGDYRSIKVTPPEIQVSAEEVSQAIEQLRQQEATYEPLVDDEGSPPITDGVTAEISFDRQVVGEESHDRTENSKVDVGGSETLPEFTQALLGARVGDTRELDINYPADYGNERLAGKSAHYVLVVKSVNRKLLPELDAAFAKKAGAVESVEALREHIHTQMLHERQHAAEHAAKEQIVADLLAAHPIPLPESLVNREVDRRLERGLRSLASQGVDPNRLKLDWGKMRDGQREAAERALRSSLLLERIAAKENIEAGENEVDFEVHRLAQQVGQSVAALRPKLIENGAMEGIKEQIRNEKTLDFLFRLTTGAPAAADEG